MGGEGSWGNVGGGRGGPGGSFFGSGLPELALTNTMFGAPIPSKIIDRQRRIAGSDCLLGGSKFRLLVSFKEKNLDYDAIQGS